MLHQKTRCAAPWWTSMDATPMLVVPSCEDQLLSCTHISTFCLSLLIKVIPGGSSSGQSVPVMLLFIKWCSVSLQSEHVLCSADASVHEACRETLLLLKDYLVQASRPSLVDLTCSIVGRVLGQQEFMLRSSRVPLWSWAAVRHMDALVQLYCELAQKVSCKFDNNVCRQAAGLSLLVLIVYSCKGQPLLVLHRCFLNCLVTPAGNQCISSRLSAENSWQPAGSQQ